MRFTLIIVLVFWSASNAFSHDFYFSFAEMEYNPMTQKMELTLIVTTHDFELALEESDKKLANIASPTDTEFEMLTKYIDDHFDVTANGNSFDFKLIGHEVLLNGTTNFYLESNVQEIENELEITFDLLMNTFDEQQNKLTFYYKDLTLTAAFTRSKRTQTLLIENKEE